MVEQKTPPSRRNSDYVSQILHYFDTFVKRQSDQSDV